MIPVDLLNYQLIRLIGRGGMGEVYLARNKNIEQLVAVKALHPRYANNPVLRSRFKQEAVMLNSLNHPNIVKFLNFVENEYGVFLIMEYVDGCTLEEYINKKTGLIIEDKAYPMFTEILDAFSYAHKNGIVHRDIKPSNIFLNKDGHIKILDFGIAQIVSEVNKTQGGQAMGTPAYMSPEQVYGQNLDQRSDIYSLGVLFHQMLTGRAPYDSTTMSELEIKRLVVNEKLPRMKNYYPYISDGIQAVVDKATSKKSEDRYASCDEMKAAVIKAMNPRKLPRMPIIIAIAAAVLCLGLGLGIWDYFRTKVSYYKDYVEYYGVAKGIDGLSSREMSHREHSYRFESSRWKVRRVTLVNSQGKTIAHNEDDEYANNRYSDVYYYYGDGKKLDYKKVYDEHGKLLYKIDYDDNMKVATFKYDDEHGTAKRLQPYEIAPSDVDDLNRCSITRYLLTYDKKGLLQRVEYATGEENTPVGDANNIYGVAYSYDKKGRVTEVRFVGREGEVMSSNTGIAIKQYEYDKHNDWTQVRYLSVDEQLLQDEHNCPIVKMEYDKWGNRIAERYYMVDGVTPLLRDDVKTCGFEYEYDNNGCRVLQRCIDGEGNMMTSELGYAQVRMTYNDDAFLIQTDYLNEDNKRVYNANLGNAPASQVKYTYNEKGLEMSRARFDAREQRLEDASGIHKYEYQYDSVGNLVKVLYYNKDEKPAHYRGLYSSATIAYDDLYRCKEIAFYNDNGQLTPCEDGFAKCEYTYDKTGNITQIEFYGTDGKTHVNSHEGYAVQKIAYDNLGHIKTIHYYDAAMKPSVPQGYFAKEYVYDSNTNFTTQEKFYNAAGAVSTVNHYTYDNNGNLTASWTVNGAGTLLGTVEKYEYDGHHRVCKVYNTDLSGKKVNAVGLSYCETLKKYDARGNITEETFLDVNGKPAVDEEMVYKRIVEYDERNYCVYTKNLGKDNKPVHGGGANPETKITYDDRGNVTSLVYLDGYGKPYTCSEGYHRLDKKYNENNLLASISYRNVQGGLTVSATSGYAKINYAYDSKRNLVEEKYFAASGSVKNYVTYAYNDKNQMTEACMYNASGKLDDSVSGFSKVIITYDSDGLTPVKRTYYRAGAVYAWQSYNAKTEEWSDYKF